MAKPFNQKAQVFQFPQNGKGTFEKKKFKVPRFEKIFKVLQGAEVLKKNIQNPTERISLQRKKYFQSPSFEKKKKKILSSWTSLRHPH